MKEQMKAFDTLTDEELLALTDEQIQRYIDIECCEEGVPLEDEAALGEKPKVDYPAPTIVGYKVGDLIFLDEGDAKIVASLETMRVDYDYSLSGYDSGLLWLEPRSLSVETVKFTTEDAVRKAWPLVKQQKAELDAWEERKKQVATNAKKRNEVAERIWAPINRATAFSGLCERLAATFGRYVETAGGDIETAKRFMAMAHPQFEGKAKTKALEVYAASLSADNREKVVIS